MFRVAQKLIPKRQHIVSQYVRHQSQPIGRPQKSSGGAGMGVAIAAGGITAGLGGVVGYASWSDENRKSVDDSIPGFQYITDAVLGVSKPSAPPPAPVISAPNPKVIPAAHVKPNEDALKVEQSASLLEKKIAREKRKEDSDKTVQENSKDTAESFVPAQIVVKSEAPKHEKKTEESKPSVESSPPTSVGLTVATKSANKSVTTALMAAEEAAEVVQKELNTAMKGLGEGSITEGIKSSVGAAITSAEEALDEAQNCINKLSNSITASKNDNSASSDSISLAEQTANELSPALIKVQTILSDSLNNLLTFETLNEALLEARFKLSSELERIMPGVNSLEADKQLKLMLGQAYLKMAALQKVVGDKQKFIDELRKKGGDEAMAVNGDLQGELDKLRHQLTLQHKSDLSRQKEELEAEVRGQLKRQAAAHSDHLGDMLTKKELEITKAWQTKLFDEIIKEKDRHLKEIATVKGKVLGLKSAVEERADADKNAFGARRLWLACNSLHNALRLGKADASDFTDQLEPLDKHMAAISVAGVEDEFISVILGSLDDDKIYTERGVYTEQALRHRFSRVAIIARKVALVPENGGSLMRYLLSYMQSILIIPSTPANCEAILFDTPVDVDALNTFDILDRARVSLDADDLTNCVRWLNQLTGESRNVSKDWVVEARRTLAAKQAADALMAHAATVTARAV